MFGWFKERAKFAHVAGIWFDITNIDTGDNGQVAAYASNLMKISPISAEDAWLTAVVNWTNNMPYRETRVLLAKGVTHFIDDPRSHPLFSHDARSAAAFVAFQILGQDS